MSKRKYELDKSELLARALKNQLDEPTLRAVADTLNEDPKYALEVDPTGMLGMSEKEKNFTKWYMQHRNIAVASQLAGVSVEDGMLIYASFACQSELSRMDMAYKLRQLNNSTLTLEQIGSILTGYVLDQLPEVERLSTKEKIGAMKMIIDLHALKQKVIEEAKPIDVVDIEDQIKDMSVDGLMTLIEQTKSSDIENDEKEQLIMQIDDASALSNDDLHYLRTLSIKELKKLLKEKNEMEHKTSEKKEKKEQTISLAKSAKTPIDETDIIDGDDITGD